MHYYQFNIGDYASHTSRLSPMEDLAYRRLLDLYYLNEQPLNGCSTGVAREIGLVEHVSSVEYVLSKFFTFENDCYKQKRIDIEIKKYKSNAKNKSKAGKASAKARQAKAISNVTPVEQTLNTKSTDEQLNINHKPLTNNHKPLTNNHKPLTNIKRSTAKADIDFSSFGMTDDQVSEVKRIRRMNKGGSITQRVANALAKEFHQAAVLGYSFDELLTEWELRGWKSFKSEWIKPRAGMSQNHSAVTDQNINNIGEWLNE